MLTIVYAWGSAEDENLALAVQTVAGLHSNPGGVPSGTAGYLAQRDASTALVDRWPALGALAIAVAAGSAIAVATPRSSRSADATGHAASARPGRRGDGHPHRHGARGVPDGVPRGRASAVRCGGSRPRPPASSPARQPRRRPPHPRPSCRSPSRRRQLPAPAARPADAAAHRRDRRRHAGRAGVGVEPNGPDGSCRRTRRRRMVSIRTGCRGHRGPHRARRARRLAPTTRSARSRGCATSAPGSDVDRRSAPTARRAPTSSNRSTYYPKTELPIAEIFRTRRRSGARDLSRAADRSTGDGAYRDNVVAIARPRVNKQGRA